MLKAFFADLEQWPGLERNNNFKLHIFTILCEKINNQFNVIRLFRKFISTRNMMRLYKAFKLLHFYFCSVAWHFCGKRNADKMESMNKRILRFKLNTVIPTTYVSNLKNQEQPRCIVNVSWICSLYFLNLLTLTAIQSIWKTCLFYVPQLVLSVPKLYTWPSYMY